jgi:hypothetical protein
MPGPVVFLLNPMFSQSAQYIRSYVSRLISGCSGAAAAAACHGTPARARAARAAAPSDLLPATTTPLPPSGGVVTTPL